MNKRKANTKIRVKLSLVAAFIIAALAVGNILVFAKSVRLSDTIVTLETDTLKFKKENVQLRQDLYSQNSLSNLRDLATQLGFTKAARPISLEEHHYALVR